MVHLCSRSRSTSGFDNPNERWFVRYFDPTTMAGMLAAIEELLEQFAETSQQIAIKLPGFD